MLLNGLSTTEEVEMIQTNTDIGYAARMAMFAGSSEAFRSFTRNAATSFSGKAIHARPERGKSSVN